MTVEFFEKIEGYNKSFDRTKVKIAFEFVAEKYKDTEGSIAYPLEVLEILLPLRPDEDTIIAVLLHDLYVLSFLKDQTVKDLFGPNVLNLLVSLKRLLNLNYGENERSTQIEVLRKMFLTMAKDLRVILIWLAQRLYNMQKLHNFSEDESKSRIAKETMDVYVPIASRLGIYRMKTQLEDLSFKYLHPEDYENINKQVTKFGETRKLAIEAMQQRLQNFLFARGIRAEVMGRLKNVYSIYAKLSKKGGSTLDDIFDLFAMRIILPAKSGNVDHLYTVLGLIHSEWKPVSSRFKDYIAVPKPNGYRSLHTVVLGLSPKDMDQPVEIQIRDEHMHRESEFGVASHWLYKAKKSIVSNLSSHVEWLRGLERIHEFFDSESEVMKEVAVDIFKDRIFVLTPRGEVKDLPLGAIPLDFAYAIHTDVGHKCISAKVNGNVVPLDYSLKNGEVVEIVTRNDATPKLRWLSMVKTGFARNKIKFWFSSQHREKNIKEGKKLINAQLERLKKPVLDPTYSILKNFGGKTLTLLERENILEEIGKGGKLASDIVRKIYPYEKNVVLKKTFVPTDPEFALGEMEKEVLENQVVVAGESSLPIRMASCCGPKMGDKILGYVTRIGKVSIHKYNCKLLDNLNGERILFAEWKKHGGRHSKKIFRVGIKLTVVSRVGLIHDITSAVSDLNINIVDVVIKKGTSGFYNDYFVLDLDNLDKFDQLLDKLEDVKGVMKVVREDRIK